VRTTALGSGRRSQVNHSVFGCRAGAQMRVALSRRVMVRDDLGHVGHVPAGAREVGREQLLLTAQPEPLREPTRVQERLPPDDRDSRPGSSAAVAGMPCGAGRGDAAISSQMASRRP
jgi:hypothetical protein